MGLRGGSMKWNINANESNIQICNFYPFTINSIDKIDVCIY